MWRIIAAALLAAWLPSGCAAAGKKQIEQTAAPARTEFCWPLADFRYSRCQPTGAWLAPRGRNSHHLGVDMFAPIGRPVRAIADGVVHDISTSGWGPGNVAVMLRHRLADGRWFIALYGHIRNVNGLRKGSHVQGCQTVGLVGPYRAGSHLHLGIIAPGKLPHAPYGTSKRGDHNNFIDPVRFLQTGLPEAGGCVSQAEAADRPAASEPAEETRKAVNAPVLTSTKKVHSKKTAAAKKSSAKKKPAAKVKQVKRKSKSAARSAKKTSSKSSKKTPTLKGGSKRSVSGRARK
uniref:M23 family metallopeptidase n=1 Tax=Candidatus Electronema sp. TaxID=2698783 RepID=UPI0040576247